ncbi:hypothetical protein [Endozoicomonas elysicola]|uniref:Uncharacterized protein n=1 Tax=Endozoicomonas elysicola TaxID=305900 RepID=A0A081K7M8_9GAMM|nr:hypothetical protein [Endozoicomonas elysicola]KEI70154.1 hypothetical protein GV64_04815 [Endozoicomonas elysicola]
MNIHKLVSLFLAIIYMLIFNGFFEYYSGFNNAQDFVGSVLTTRANGVYYIYLAAIASLYFLVFPQHAARKLSPLSKGLKEQILPANFWVCVGYFLSVVVFLTLEVFR